MSADAARQPVARGSLFDTPFCHLALYLGRHAHGGTLVVVGHESGEATIRFQRGRPTGARLPWRAANLLEGILPLCPLPQGEFTFFEDDLIGQDPDALSGVVDPYELLAASLDGYVRDDMVDAVLARFAGRALRMLPGREVERLRLRAEHGPLLELIRAAPATADELIAQTPLPQLQVRRVLYALIATNVISAHDQRESETFRSQVEPRASRPSSSSSMPAARPGGSGGSLPAAGAPGGVPSGRPAAWQQLASLRPGGASAPPRTSVQPTTVTAQSQVALRPTSVAPDDEDKPARIKRADLLLQRGRSDDALAIADALLASEPYDAELLALRAHTLFEKHQVNPDGLPRTVLDAIREALEADDENPRALYTKGLMYKRAGDSRKAVLYFRRVLQADPKHLDAQRELRLAKLRE
jgi:tetratricopeptide (TPR) repeat protein